MAFHKINPTIELSVGTHVERLDVLTYTPDGLGTYIEMEGTGIPGMTLVCLPDVMAPTEVYLTGTPTDETPSTPFTINNLDYNNGDLLVEAFTWNVTVTPPVPVVLTPTQYAVVGLRGSIFEEVIAKVDQAGVTGSYAPLVAGLDLVVTGYDVKLVGSPSVTADFVGITVSLHGTSNPTVVTADYAITIDEARPELALTVQDMNLNHSEELTNFEIGQVDVGATVSMTGAPGALNIRNSSGDVLISGTANQHMTGVVTVTAILGEITETATFNLLVGDGIELDFELDADLELRVGVPVTDHQIGTVTPGAEAYLAPLPDGITVSVVAGNILINGTPTEALTADLNVLVTFMSQSTGASLPTVILPAWVAPSWQSGFPSTFEVSSTVEYTNSWVAIAEGDDVTVSTSGSLPSGITLIEDGAGYYLSGQATDVGNSYPVTFTAQGHGASADFTVTFTVVQGYLAPGFVVDQTVVAGQTGIPLNVHLGQVVGPFTHVFVEHLVPGLMVEVAESDVYITGTPSSSLNQPATQVTLFIENGTETSEFDFTYAIIPGDAPELTITRTSLVIVAGVDIDEEVATFIGDNVTITNNLMVPGLEVVVEGNSVYVRGTPGTSAAQSMILSATNDASTTTGAVALTTPVIYVTPGEDGSAGTTDITITQGRPVSAMVAMISLPYTGVDAVLPNGLAFVEDGNGGLSLTGMSSETGLHTVTVIVHNGEDTAEFTLNITMVMVKPMLALYVGEYVVTVGAVSNVAIGTVNGTVESLDSDLTIPGLTLSVSGGLLYLSGTATATGNDAVTVTVSNASGSASGTFTVMAVALATVTIAVSTVNMTVGTAIDLVIGQFAGTDAVLSSNLASTGITGVQVVASDNQIRVTGTPTAVFDEVIQITATNNLGSDSRDVTLVAQAAVVPVAHSFTATTTTITGVAGTELDETALATIVGEYDSFDSIPGIPGVTVGLDTDGVTVLMSGTPLEAFAGTITLTAGNQGLTTTLEVTVTITEPVVVSPPTVDVILEDVQLTTGDLVEEIVAEITGDFTSMTSDLAIDGLILEAVGNLVVISGTPTAEVTGVPVTFTVMSANGNVQEQLTVTVTDPIVIPPEAPVFTNKVTLVTGTVGEELNQLLTTITGEHDSTDTDLPVPGLSLVIEGKMVFLTGTPTAAFDGPVRFDASNQGSLTTMSFTLTVEEPAVPSEPPVLTDLLNGDLNLEVGVVVHLELVSVAGDFTGQALDPVIPGLSLVVDEAKIILTGTPTAEMPMGVFVLTVSNLEASANIDYVGEVILAPVVGEAPTLTALVADIAVEINETVHLAVIQVNGAFDTVTSDLAVAGIALTTSGNRIYLTGTPTELFDGILEVNVSNQGLTRTFVTQLIVAAAPVAPVLTNLLPTATTLTVGTEVSLELMSITGDFTGQVIDPVIPGMTLEVDEAKISLQGTPTQVMPNDVFVVRVYNFGTSSTLDYTFEVVPAVVIDVPPTLVMVNSNIDAIVGRAFDTPIIDITGPFTSVESNGAAYGLTAYSDGTRIFVSGNFTEEVPSFDLEVTVRNGTEEAIATVHMTAVVPQAPTVSLNGSVWNYEVGTDVNVAVGTVSGAFDSFSAFPSVPGVALMMEGTQIFLRGRITQQGFTEIIITVGNMGSEETATITLEATAPVIVINPPLVEASGDVNAEVGVPLNSPVISIVGAYTSVTSDLNVPGLSLVEVLEGLAIRGTPLAEFDGEVTVTVFNQTESASASFTLTVVDNTVPPEPPKPVLTRLVSSTVVGRTDRTLSVNVVRITGAHTSVTSDLAVPGLTLTETAGVLGLSGQPTVTFTGDITITVHNDTVSSVITVSLRVNAPPTPPAAGTIERVVDFAHPGYTATSFSTIPSMGVFMKDHTPKQLEADPTLLEHILGKTIKYQYNYSDPLGGANAVTATVHVSQMATREPYTAQSSTMAVPYDLLAVVRKHRLAAVRTGYDAVLMTTMEALVTYLCKVDYLPTVMQTVDDVEGQLVITLESVRRKAKTTITISY